MLLAACSSGASTTSTPDGEPADSEVATEVAAARESSVEDDEPEALEELTVTADGATAVVTPALNTESDADDVPDEVEPPEVIRSAQEAVDALGRGMNLGNVLEAPREGVWGDPMEAADFVTIAEAGFDHVRLPVSWAGYASEQAPFLIPTVDDPTISHPDYTSIFERVDWAIEQAEANDLLIIVNMHHYDEAHEDPAAHRDRILAIWEQVAAHYSDAGDDVIFELFNEPHGVYTEQPELWNELAADLLAVVRETNPTRKVLVGPVGFNDVDELPSLELANDPNLIATVHLYEPFGFTHQGAEWVDPTPPFGVRWSTGQVALAESFHERSWDVETEGTADAIQVNWQRQWAGFAVGWTGERQPTDVSFRVDVDQATRLQVGCQAPDGSHFAVQQIDIAAGTGEYGLDLSTCAPSTVGIGMLNANPALVPIRLLGIETCWVGGECAQMFSNAEVALRGALVQAAEWSEASGVPIHLGEFGAFAADGSVPVADRAAWTATVVDEADKLGIPFSYWDFHADFAAYDGERNVWIPELRDALLG